MTIGDRIKKLRIEKGLSQEVVANAISTTKQAIYKYENNIVTNIPMDKIQSLARFFNISPAYLMGWNETSETEAIAVSGIRPIVKKRFKILGEIACGSPIYANEDHESYIDASANIDADFCLVAKGDSMTGARIYDGDVVFIKQQSIVANGEIAAVIIDDEATLKTWYYYPDKQKLVLSPANQSYEPLVYSGPELDSVTCLGKAVCFMSKI